MNRGTEGEEKNSEDSWNLTGGKSGEQDVPTTARAELRASHSPGAKTQA